MTEKEIMDELREVTRELRSVITWHVLYMVPLKKTQKFLDKISRSLNVAYREKVLSMGEKLKDLYSREEELTILLANLKHHKN
jgi:hypothetical protein